MKRRFLFALLLVSLLLVTAVSADVVNTTQLGASSAGIYTTVDVAVNGVNIYNPSEDLGKNPSGEKYAIIQTTYKLTNDNTVLKTVYTMKNGNTIEVDTSSVTTGFLSAEYHITNTNGITKIIPYTMWIPWSGSNAPNIQTRILYSNSTGLWYLYTGLQSDTGNPLDTVSESFAQIDSPGTNPIAFVTQYTISGGSLTATYLSVPSDELIYDSGKTVESAGGGTVTTTWPEKLLQILDYIVKAILSLSGILGKAASLFNITTAFFIFFTAGEIFVGLNTVYIAIAILLSIEDSDDIFKAFGQFYRRMMKLFRFYMELFKSLKEIIKWW